MILRQAQDEQMFCNIPNPAQAELVEARALMVQQ